MKTDIKTYREETRGLFVRPSRLIRDPYYGVYNKQGKKVLLRLSKIVIDKFSSDKERFLFENSENGSKIIQVSNPGTYDELMSDRVVFSDLVRLSGSKASRFDPQVIKSKKLLVLRGKSKYSLMCFNLTRREAKAIHFVSSYSRNLEFEGWEREPEDGRIIIDLKLVLLILKKGEFPVFQNKTVLMRDIGSLGLFRDENLKFRHQTPKDSYFFQESSNFEELVHFEEVKGKTYFLGYYFYDEGFRQKPGASKEDEGMFSAYIRDLRNYRKKIDYMIFMEETSQQKSSQVRSPNKSETNSDQGPIIPGGDVGDLGFYHIYLQGSRGQLSQGDTIVYKLRLPKGLDSNSSMEYRISFREDFNRLFILSTDSFAKKLTLSTIRLDQLARVIQG